ncbi:Rhodanese-like domain-containing protein [Dendryphion nanum]|uniref:Rhodanese-like domain-containing protein n=1 Tax=Dendryphion nanum TaxID=256645 RepID=A0A9P9IIM0_9PLEO|nr:Rhodanese-like domain-containing protein [Dendryphion nanum]
MAAENSVTSPPWHAAYPSPRDSNVTSIPREEILKMLDHEEVGGRDFVLIDLRRNDYEGGSIRTSINLPAQSLYPTIPTLYTIFKAAGIRKVICYCSSSRGRGPRAAGWFNDYIVDQSDIEMKSLVMTEGIKGWAGAGPEYVQWMTEYDASFWTRS